MIIFDPSDNAKKTIIDFCAFFDCSEKAETIRTYHKNKIDPRDTTEYNTIYKIISD